MDLGLKDKSAAVLASTAGLGRAVAEALLAEGARVAICGRDPQRLEAARRELEGAHPDRVHGEALDVADPEALRAHLEGVRSRWGGVDVLVINAGGPPPGPAVEVDEEDLDAAFALTLRSAVTAVRAVLPGMRERGFGRVVSLSSLSVRQPIDDLVLSNSMRAGLAGFLKTLASEVAADGVLVHTLCTGMFDTDRLTALFEARGRARGTPASVQREAVEAQIPLGRIGQPSELAAVVAFLCSEPASYLSGLALPVDGGVCRSLY